MTLAILSDIHGNLEALEAVLKELSKREVDAFYCLGDIVGYNPDPGPCVEKILELGARCIKGNHERAVLGELPLYIFNELARAAVLWTRRVLGPEHMEFLRSLPEKIVEEFCFVHGSLRDPDYYILSPRDAVMEIYALEEMGRKVLFFGHTHVQGAFLLKESSLSFTTRSFYLDHYDFALVNPGAVGQPRDGDPRAAALLCDSSTGLVEFLRIEYPVEKVVSKIEERGLPRWLGERLKKGI